MLHRLAGPERVFIAAAAIALLASCARNQLAKAPGPSPDYSLAASWLSLPGPSASLNQVPAGFSDLERASDVDVFYIYPTTAFMLDNLPTSYGYQNAAYDDGAADDLAYEIAANQAGTFNATGRIFAPYYRQVVMDEWFEESASQVEDASELAYQDARRAFEYFVAHYNKGRPIILVGHSQGSMIGLRLLKDEFDGKPLFSQLIAAYLPGQSMNQSTYASYTQVHPCAGPLDTGCINNWASFRNGVSDKALRSFLAVAPYWAAGNANYSAPALPIFASMNPITWSTAAALASAAKNVGPLSMRIPYPPVYSAKGSRYPMGSITSNSFSAQTYGQSDKTAAIGVFLKPDPQPSQFAAYVPIVHVSADFEGVWHLYDFNLYWTNIRQNARDRSNAFLKTRGNRKPLISGPIFLGARAGEPFSYRVRTLNPAAHFRAVGLRNLAIDETSGTIGGTPLAGTYAIVITATNRFGSSTGELALAVSR